eukprot:751237-Hanusia_phi.AAC.2
MGSTNDPSSVFIFCDDMVQSGDQACPCFIRRFFLPLKRASAGFDLSNLREGRVDVGCRCITGRRLCMRCASMS